MATSCVSGENQKNRIFLIRHGQSEANFQDKLISLPEVGISSYGLTKKGEKQTKEAINTLEAKFSEYPKATLSERIIIYSSDFKRTRETAEIIHSHFSVKAPICFEVGLRERGVGSYENGPENLCSEILSLDVSDPTHTKGGCESLMNMVSRVTRVINDIDKKFEDKLILIVSHGDTLMTLFAVCSGIPPNERYKHISHFSNCDIREIDYL